MPKNEPTVGGKAAITRSGCQAGSLAPASKRVFLLSPAYCGGKRAGLLLRPTARFPLAIMLRSESGATIRDVFTFASGLYFRGKAAYSAVFGRPPIGTAAGLVMVPGEGLVEIETRIRLNDLERIASVPVDASDPRFLKPLVRDARKLSKALGNDGEAVLLGSVATDKYREPLLKVLGERLLFPSDFIGRGDMSRGGLMLRCAASGEELAYQRVLGANYHGARPPKLTPKSRTPADSPDLA
jgi:hypothetical protein